MKNKEIKPHRLKRHLKYILFIEVFSFISMTLQAAEAPKATIGTLNNAVPGQPVTIPVTVSGFTNIGSFYLYLEYDFTKLQYSSVTINPALTANFAINDNDLGNGTHRIIFSCTIGSSGASLPDASSMVELVFNFISGPVELKWNTSRDNYCKYNDPTGTRLNDNPKSTFYINGEVSGLYPSAPVIDSITQPTYELSTGSVELTGLPAGSWTIDPGAITGTGPSYIISGLSEGTYNFTVTNTDGYTSLPSADVIIIKQPITSANNIPLNELNGSQGLPISNYPNPFSQNTTIEYTLPVAGKVSVKLYNQLGKQVASLIDATQVAGTYTVHGYFNGLHPGVYIVRIRLDDFHNQMVGMVRLNILK